MPEQFSQERLRDTAEKVEQRESSATDITEKQVSNYLNSLAKKIENSEISEEQAQKLYAEIGGILNALAAENGDEQFEAHAKTFQAQVDQFLDEANVPGIELETVPHSDIEGEKTTDPDKPEDAPKPEETETSDSEKIKAARKTLYEKIGANKEGGRWEKFKAGLVDGVLEAAAFVEKLITDPIGAVKEIVNGLWEAVKSPIQTIKAIGQSVWKALTNIYETGVAASAVALAALGGGVTAVIVKGVRKLVPKHISKGNPNKGTSTIPEAANDNLPSSDPEITKADRMEVPVEQESLRTGTDDLTVNRFDPEEMASNAKLNPIARQQAAAKAIGRELTLEQSQALLRAHEIGAGKQGPYTKRELVEKRQVLMESGFTKAEANTLMDKGLAGDWERMTVRIGNLDSVKSFDQLEAYLRQLPEGGIQGSDHFFSSNELITLVREVKSGEKSSSYITRSAGLRAKVDELLARPRMRIEDVKSFGELENIIRDLPEGGLQGSGKFFSSEELLQIVNQVADGKLPSHYLTRTNGLRAKVEEIIEQNKLRKAAASLDEVRNFSQLQDYLRNLPEGGIQGTDKFFTSDELLGIVDQVVNGELPATYVTRTGGLRDKVKEIIDNKKPRVTPRSFDDITNFDQLEGYLRNLPEGGLQGSSEFFSSEDLISLVRQVRRGELEATSITRTGGLRQKVQELQHPAQRPSRSHDSPARRELGIDYSDLRASFERIARDPNQPALTRELLSDPNLRPVEVVKIGDQEFFMSKVIKTQGRDQALMYVRSADGTFRPRVLYKSKSDGGWRSSPGYDPRGIYSKGNGIHYTQETKPHNDIVGYLERNADNYARYQGDLISDRFNFGDDNMRSVYTYNREVSRYNDRGALGQFQEHSPGQGLPQGRGPDIFRSLNFADPRLKGFLPDFRSPSKTTKQNHTLLGDITIESYPATLNGRRIEWNMAYDSSGRVWVDGIRFTDSDINSYGVPGEVIDSGLLTNKPIEYNQQTGGFIQGRDSIPFNRSYSDITPLLDNLLPIRQFRQARGIHRS